MNYFWEVALRADDLGIPRESLQYVPAKSCSPYIEVSFVDLNEDSLYGQKIEGNPLYRFTSIFGRIFDANLDKTDGGAPNGQGLRQARELFFTGVMQFIIQLDLRQGLCHEEYYLRFILHDLLNGVGGRPYAAGIGQFNHRELRRVLGCLLQLYQCGFSLALFRRAMRAVYPDSLVYASNDLPHEILVYIGMNETEKESQKIDFLQNAFLPINYTVHLFWEHHFGIIDVDVTMELDEMVLF